MTFTLEVDSRVSEELSEYVETLVNNPDLETPVTLGLVRDTLQQHVGDELTAEEHHQFGNESSLYAETLALIEEYGEDMLAVEFIVSKASDELSELIEALLDNADEELPPTLGGVHRAIGEGIAARLVGDGAFEQEMEQTLQAEIEALIGHYGEDYPAENLLRFQ